MKAAIVVLSDPKSGIEEALGRVFNALASAYDFKHSETDLPQSLHWEFLDYSPYNPMTADLQIASSEA